MKEAKQQNEDLARELERRESEHRRQVEISEEKIKSSGSANAKKEAEAERLTKLVNSLQKEMENSSEKYKAEISDQKMKFSNLESKNKELEKEGLRNLAALNSMKQTIEEFKGENEKIREEREDHEKELGRLRRDKEYLENELKTTQQTLMTEVQK